MRSKVIVPEDDPQDWCALGFFVPKPDGVRMVTDYSKRPVHPFPSMADIVKSIPPERVSSRKWMPFMGIFSWHSTKNRLSSRLSCFPWGGIDI